LYGVFNAIDLAANGTEDFHAENFAVEAANAAVKVPNTNGSTAYFAAKAANFAARLIGEAIHAAKRARAVHSRDSRANDNATRAAGDRVARAVAATAAAAVILAAPAYPVANTTEDKHKELEKILLNNIEAFRTDNLSALNNDTGIYGETWPNFLEDLNASGCGYWARLYEDLFTNGFVIDKKELERRLNIPDEIKKKGAAAVGLWLEKDSAKS